MVLWKEGAFKMKPHIKKYKHGWLCGEPGDLKWYEKSLDAFGNTPKEAYEMFLGYKNILLGVEACSRF